jgi:CRP/FNR family cyclic AMP-dependent transcriptional regulator
MIFEVLGWLAAAFTFGAYAMKTMLPLRSFAIGANILFIVYSAALSIYPTLVLHLALLPFNLARLIQLLRQTRDVRRAQSAEGLPPGLRSYLKPVPLEPDRYLFRKGDPADRIYVVEAGRIHLEEVGRDIEAGEMFGELAFFSDSRIRTLSARSVGAARVLALSEDEFMALFHQNPAFGFYVVKLMAQRLARHSP